MKRILCTAVIAAIASISAYADNGDGHDNANRDTRKEERKERRDERKEIRLHSVNVMTEQEFYYDFPRAKDVKWTQDHFEEANFMDGTVEKTAYYDWQNKLVGTTTHVDYSELSARAKRYIAKKYPGYTVKDVIMFDDNEANDTDMYLFDTSFEDEDTYFPVMQKGSKEIILEVTMKGDVSFFGNYKK